MSEECDFGLIGLAVMGENLALNIESRGYSIAVFNRTIEKVDKLVNGRAAGKRFVGCHSIQEFVASLKRPRKAMMLVQAGPAVDALIDQLIPLMSRGDVIIDGGNTHFADTERRTKYVEEKGLLFVGTGVSGGEGRCAIRSQHDARRYHRRMASGETNLSIHRGEGRPQQRHPVLRVGGSTWRWPLRKDGTQRH